MCVEECVMGKDKRRNFYFSNKLILAKLDKEENKSELLTQLLTDYYNKDMDYLEAEKQALAEKTAINQSRIDNLLRLQEKANKLKAEKLEQEKQAEEHNKLLDNILNLWKNNIISQKTFDSLFEDGKLIKQKANKVLKNAHKKTT